MKRELVLACLSAALLTGCPTVQKAETGLKKEAHKAEENPVVKDVGKASEGITNQEVNIDGLIDKATGVHETKEQLREDVKEEDAAADFIF